MKIVVTGALKKNQNFVAKLFTFEYSKDNQRTFC